MNPLVPERSGTPRHTTASPFGGAVVVVEYQRFLYSPVRIPVLKRNPNEQALFTNINFSRMNTPGLKGLPGGVRLGPEISQLPLREPGRYA